jgi:hypothetical protein
MTFLWKWRLLFSLETSVPTYHTPYLFVWSTRVFNNTVNNFTLYTNGAKWLEVSRQWVTKDVKGVCPWPILGHNTGTCLDELNNTTKPLTKYRVTVEIRTRHLPSASQKRYCLNNILQRYNESQATYQNNRERV